MPSTTRTTQESVHTVISLWVETHYFDSNINEVNSWRVIIIVVLKHLTTVSWNLISISQSWNWKIY